MPQTSALDESSAQTPKYITAALGVKRDWVAEARCRPAASGWDPRTPWLVSNNETVTIGSSTYSGETLIAYALLVCSACPAQWDCTRFALKTMDNWGTWGVDITDLRWLHRQRGHGLGIVDYAERRGIPVQVVAREGRRAAARDRHLAAI